MPGNRNRVPSGLQVNQQPGISGRHVVHLHHVRPRHQLLQLRHAQTVELLQLPLAHLRLVRLGLLDHVVILQQLRDFLILFSMLSCLLDKHEYIETTVLINYAFNYLC